MIKSTSGTTRYKDNLTLEAKGGLKTVELVEIIGKPWPLPRKTSSLPEVGISFIKFWGDAVTSWVAPESMYDFWYVLVVNLLRDVK